MQASYAGSEMSCNASFRTESIAGQSPGGSAGRSYGACHRSRWAKNIVESVITRTSAEELALKKGDAVTVVIKSTEVMLQKGMTLFGGPERQP